MCMIIGTKLQCNCKEKKSFISRILNLIYW